MKNTLYLLLLFCISSTAFAQTDEERDKQGNIDQQAQEKWEAGAQKVMEGLFNQDGETKYADNYSFDVALMYHIDVFKKNGSKKDHSEMEILINKTSHCIAMLPIEEGKKQENIIVYDAENKSILTLIRDENNNKTGIAIKYDPSNVELEEKDEVEIDFEKTTEQKEILGYTCQKYISRDEGAITEFWVTEEVELNMQDVFGVMAQGKAKNNKGFSDDYPKGMLMESTTIEENGTSSTMKIAKLDLDSEREVTTTGYQMMNLGSMFSPSPEE